MIKRIKRKLAKRRLFKRIDKLQKNISEEDYKEIMEILEEYAQDNVRLYRWYMEWLLQLF